MFCESSGSDASSINTMKKKEVCREYQVGEVSGSLFQEKRAPSGPLSALFGRTSTSTGVLFKTAPQLPELSDRPEAPGVKGEAGQKAKGKKAPKVKTEAECKLENRELGLQNADWTEPVRAGRRKRGAEEAGLEKGPEHWVLKHQRRPDEQSETRRTAFVGNLPVGCTKKTLLRLFKGDGAIQSIRFRSLVREDLTVSRKVATIKRQAHPSRQSINAYVVFKEPQSVAKALQRNGIEIQKDFVIRVDRVDSKAAQSHDHKRSVFVGNLNFELKDSALRRHFESCGAVEAVRLVRDHNTGLGKGFGYVLFKVQAGCARARPRSVTFDLRQQSCDSVQLALKLEGSQLDGRPVRVKRSTKKEAGSGPAAAKVEGQQPGRNFKGEMAQPKQKDKNKSKKLKKAKKQVHI